MSDEIDEDLIKQKAAEARAKGLTYSLEFHIERFNKTQGNMKYIDCPECKNKGVIYFIKDGQMVCKECKCMKARRAYKEMELDGVLEQVEKSTFENFMVREEWQNAMKEKALQFCEELGRMFYVGGNSGCGKSHICSAILGKIVKTHYYCSRYMAWNSEIKKLCNFQRYDTERYNEIIEDYKNAKVLYIDDFLKPIGNNKPSEQQLTIAFDIIDYRYKNSNLITIISSELWLEDIIGNNESEPMDEALGSRIYEMTESKLHERQRYYVKVKKDSKRNKRLNFSDAI